MKYFYYSLAPLFVFLFSWSCEKANKPVEILSLTASDSTIDAGSSIDLICEATDSDGDDLVYSWDSYSGNIESSGNTAVWTAPQEPGIYFISCWVTDDFGTSDAATIAITVEPANSVSIKGQVTNAVNRNPIPDVTVTISGRSTTTDQNGDYEIIFVQEGARRLPIVSAKRQIGGASMLPNRQSYLPLKLNAGGVMPIIFASALIFLPITIANFSKSPLLIRAASSLNPGASNPWPYAITFFALILGFAYFYASLTINPIDIAANLKRGGVAIPGVRPGSASAKYLSGVQNRLTLLGGLFLGAVAIIPAAVERATNVHTFQGLGATSLLILVGVAIDTAKQVQTYVISQRYEGLVRQ